MKKTWLEGTIEDIVANVPIHCSIDLRATHRLVLLRAAQNGKTIDSDASRTQIVSTCLAQGRSVEF